MAAVEEGKTLYTSNFVRFDALCAVVAVADLIFNFPFPQSTERL
jgi:hypothetical protein